MKILVVYYSRQGHTERLAKEIARKLHGKLELIEDSKNRDHLISWEKSAFDEELKTPTKIIHPENDPKDFDLTIIGTPIWDGITPPVKAYLKFMKKRFRKVGFFITFSAAAEDAAYQMEKLSKKPIAVLEVQDRQIENKDYKNMVKEFVRKFK